MDDPKADIMMYFVLEGGGSIDGESSLQITAGDKFMKGFSASSDASDYSNFFEVSDFNFSLKVKAGEGDGGTLKAGQRPAMPQTSAAGTPAAPQKAGDEFERWRSAKPEELEKMKYVIEFGTFSFKRTIDAASPIFFQNCANQVKFKEAVLVKRLMARVGSSGEGQAFMRIEFKGVTITKVSWDDGDVVKESCQFKCQDMRVQYKPQNMDGTLSSTISEAYWNQALNGVPPQSGPQGRS